MFHRLGLGPGRGGESPHRSGIADREERHAGQVEITKDKRGEYRFRLKATNGQTVAVSEGYKTKDVCLQGVESVKSLAADASVVDTTS
jgi:uncharacterized protein YegP (UPF0339 family)